MRRRILLSYLAKQNKSGDIVLPDYDTSTYGYHGLIYGLMYGTTTFQAYVFTVSAKQKNLVESGSYVKYTNNYAAYMSWYSTDGKTWTLIASGNASTINTYITYNEEYTILDNQIVEG